MTREQLIKSVALHMDEITPDSALSGSITVDGSDNNPLYELIDGLIDSGVLELFSLAPYWRLKQTPFAYSSTASSNEILVESLGSAFGSRKFIRLKVKEDFLRVAEINCTDFQRPITVVYPEQEEMGKRQHNKYLMGKEARPIGVMSYGTWTGSVCREIDCYSLASNTTVTASSGIDASYIAKPPVIKDTSTVVSVEDALGGSVLIPALEWLIASRAFGARGDAGHAGVCQQNAQNLLV